MIEFYMVGRTASTGQAVIAQWSAGLLEVWWDYNNRPRHYLEGELEIGEAQQQLRRRRRKTSNPNTQARINAALIVLDELHRQMTNQLPMFPSPDNDNNEVPRCPDCNQPIPTINPACQTCQTAAEIWDDLESGLFDDEPL